ncbi:programmed cell death protein 7-like isoform X1 [Rhinoderma darwinii]|uniref:programmed cell death protein 7-like isoform X1 n=1 Tax=Rhinoderma darwinii TaxID=43563 RepID=UPI003F664AC1
MSLEKLRKLRKEAAGRKGVCPPLSAEETFTNHIIRLRSMVHKRSALYDAEEKTLRVILEGEQEEERQREKDKRLKKEKEKTLQKQRELDSILFGDTDYWKTSEEAGDAVELRSPAITDNFCTSTFVFFLPFLKVDYRKKTRTPSVLLDSVYGFSGSSERLSIYLSVYFCRVLWDSS